MRESEALTAGFMRKSEALTAGFMRESEALAAGFIKNNKVYTEDSVSNLNFPIGTTVSSFFGTYSPPALNGSKVIGFLYNNTYYTSDFANVTPLSGVWRSRGISGETSGGYRYLIFQRTK